MRSTVHSVLKPFARRTLTFYSACSLLAACFSDGVVSAVTAPRETPANPSSAPSITLSVVATNTSLLPGENGTVLLSATFESGATVPNGVLADWTTSDSAVVIVTAMTPRSARVVGVGAGTSNITVTLAGKSASVKFTVQPTPATDDSALIVESFTMIEFEYPSARGRWFYAPQLRVRASGTFKAAFITRMEFEIPELGPAPPCNAAISVGAGAAIDLFHEIYGDYQLTFNRDGFRASGTEAKVTITVADGSGRKRNVVVKGAIVHGELPTTYTGGNPAWLCQFF